MEGISTPTDSLTISIRQKLQRQSSDEFLHRSPPTIYRVPNSMRYNDVDAYEPTIISIGPYHRGKLKLQAMENHKWRYLNDFLSSNPRLGLKRCVEEMKLLEEETRMYYSEPSELNSDEFTEMMLLDGCFYVEFLLKWWDSSESVVSSREVNEPLFNTMWILPPLVHDMFLLENQIPFLVPQRLFDLAKISLDKRCARRTLVELHFFLFNFSIPLNVEIPPTPACSVHHLLHLLYTHLLPSPQYLENKACSHMYKFSIHLHKFSIHLHNLFHKHFLPVTHPKLRQGTRPVTSSIPSVKELQDSGVRFQKTVKKVGSFMEIEFKNGIMRIPELCIYPNTVSSFRNLFAFEQCYPNSKTHFTAYTLFMAKFINSSQDVMVLKEKGIFRHGLSSDTELAILFWRLGNGVNFYYSKNYLSDVYKDVKRYHESAWNKWRASFMRDYFGNPWAFLSLLGALVLLVLAIVQTLFSVLSYYSKSE